MSDTPFSLDAWYPLLVAGPVTLRSAGDDVTPAGLRAAWRALAPGEALAVVDRARVPSARLGRMFRRGRAARVLGRMSDVTRLDRWYVLPGTGGSHTLLPRSPAGFAAGTSLLPGGRALWRVAREVLRRGARLAPALGLDELVVAVKGPAAPALMTALARPGVTVALTLGVPGPVRKAVVRAVDRRGRVLGVAKLPLTEHATERIRHEGDALAGLAAGFGPRLLDRDGGRWLWMEDVVGRRSGNRFRAQHHDFLARLTEGARSVPLQRIDIVRAARRRLAVSPPKDRELAAALRGLDEALAARGDVALLCAPAHGDFTPWNLMRTRTGLLALDWEFRLEEAPRLFDLLHFFLQTSVLVEHLAPAELVERFRADRAGPLASHSSRLGIDSCEARLHFAVYLLHQTLLDDHLHSIEHPPFVQVEWLRDARLELAGCLTRELARAPGRTHGRVAA